MVPEIDLHMAEVFLSGRLSILDLQHEQYTPTHRLAAALALIAACPGRYYDNENEQAVEAAETLFATLRTFYPSGPQAHYVQKAGYDSRVFRRAGTHVIAIDWPEGLAELVARYAGQADGGVAKWGWHLTQQRVQELLFSFQHETPEVQTEFRRQLGEG